MGKTTIEWCDQAWPIVNGCRRVSPGCGGASGVGGCYAERLAATRLRNSPKYAGLAIYQPGRGPQWTGKSRLWLPDLEMPLRLRKPSRIFVADMGDLFFEEVSDADIDQVFAVMALAERHTFQVLTKRSERMRRYFEGDPRARWADAAMPLIGAPCLGDDAQHEKISSGPIALTNVWLGVSAENQKYADERIPDLLETPAAVRWVSYEPALSPINFRGWIGGADDGGNCLRCGLRVWADDEMNHLCPDGFLEPSLHWIVVGGESGPGARPFDVAWARSTVAQCKAAGVACFVKQLGLLPWELDETGEVILFRDRHPDVYWPDADDIPSHPKGDSDVVVKIPKKSLQHAKGSEMREWPKRLRDLRVRQYPRGR